MEVKWSIKCLGSPKNSIMKACTAGFSTNIWDQQIPPSKRLEKLKSNLKQFYSIRIDKQWRIIFKWENNNVYCVEIIDYY